MRPKGKARKPKKPARPRAPRRSRAPAAVKAGPPAGQEEEPLEPEVLQPEALEGEEEALPPETTLPVPVERDLARADALQRYMAEVSRHSLLSREEEHDLAVKFRETQDPEIAYRLVTANLRLVVKIAHEYRRAAFNLLDLIQEGNVGLMQAVQKYDPFRGVKLSSYAAWWIRAYILRYLMDNWRMVKLGTTQAQRKLFFNLRKEQERLLSQGFEAAPKLLAQRLDVSEQDVREMDQRLSNDEFSIDAPIAAGQEDGRQTQGDRLVQSGAPVDEQLADQELRRIFKEKLAAFGRTLTGEKDRFLFEKRIAPPEDQEPLTLQQIGDLWGVTRERARQLEARLTDRLREYLRRELPDFAQLSVTSPEEP
ncbi:MAG TPA: RNA polymerase factor sigma-32 [Myxococcales bacterium]|nr:RNA polymerase factor sigma-32 [Myxococcales bacterium]